MTVFKATVLFCGLIFVGSRSLAVEVTAVRSERGVVVKVAGDLFAEYLMLSGHQPAIWPIIGPTGKRMTRSYPVGPLLETETKDHPHHHSLWFAHENVNGHDFWIEADNEWHPLDEPNLIKHMEFARVESGAGQAVLVTRNHWLAGNKKKFICEDERTLVFGADDASRWIDYTTKITASNGPVTFGDKKDGLLGTRVAGTIKVDSGGTIVNSVGQVNAEAWGLPAEWVDYTGPVDGETVGLAIFSHPSNFQHPCRWHARHYGMLTANPFGDTQFPEVEGFKQHSKTIAAGDSLTLRYRVYLHTGNTEQANIAEVFRDFAE